MLFPPDLLRSYNQLFLQLRTITNSSRYYIFNIIENQQPISVGQIVEISNLEQPIVSQAISTLRKSGFIVNEKRKKFVFYRVDEEFIEDIIKISFRILNLEHKSEMGLKQNYTQVFSAYKYLKSLLNQSRLILLEILNKRGTSSVSELQELTQIKQSLVSQNLKLLKELDCVVSVKKGKQVMYSLNQTKLKELDKLFE